MAKKTKIIIIILLVFALGWVVYQAFESQIQNSKYGIKTTVENVSPTGLELTVECPEKQDGDSVYWDKTGSLHWDVGYQVVEKASVFGWKKVPSPTDNYMSYAIYQPIEGTSKFEANWETSYGRLTNGVYRIGKAILNHNDERVGMCYATFLISEPDNFGVFDSIWWEILLIAFVALLLVAVRWRIKRCWPKNDSKGMVA